MQSAPPDAAVARFQDDLASLVDVTGSRLGVAVSGGPDSLALLLLANASYPGRCHAATVDHGLRPESTAEAEFVARVCAGLNVPHHTLSVAEAASGNISDWARRVRYRALDTWAAKHDLAYVMTGHHADDQLETLVLRLNRGSGVAGLSSIRKRQDKIVRPLLGWRRAELESLIATAGLTPIHDPSNVDDRFDRARLRKSLAQADWLDPIAAGASAAALAEADQALEWAVTRCFEDRIVVADGVLTFDAGHLPAELLRRLVLRSLKSIVPAAAPRAADLARLITGLREGRKVTLAGVLCRGGDKWQFARAPIRRGN